MAPFDIFHIAVFLAGAVMGVALDRMIDGRLSPGSGYRDVRVASAATLVALLAAILLIDAISPEYETEPVTLALILGAVAALVGVELRDPRHRG